MVKIVKDSVKEFFEKLGTGAVVSLAGFIIFAVATSAYFSEAYHARAEELKKSGLPFEVRMDQLAEEFEGTDGAFGTGGIDGKYLDGSIAPNGSLAGNESNSGSGSSQKPSHSHDYKEVDRKEATCTSKGKITKKCDCGDTKTESIPETDHNYVAGKVVAATCIEKGRTELVCTGCGDAYWVDTTYADHIYVPGEGTDATCTEGGTKITVCSICGNTITETIEKLGHTWETDFVVDKEPNCTEDGIAAIHCIECGEIKETMDLLALGHKEYEYLISDASFWEDGKISVKCEVCYEHFRDIEIPAKGGAWRYVIICTIGGGLLLLATSYIVSKFKKRK